MEGPEGLAAPGGGGSWRLASSRSLVCILWLVLGVAGATGQEASQEVGQVAVPESASEAGQVGSEGGATAEGGDSEDEGAVAPSTWVTELTLEVPPADAWLEISPLVGPEAPRLVVFDDRQTAAPSRLDPELPQGPAMVCSGAPGHGTRCVRAFLYRGISARGAPDPASLEVAVDWQAGAAVEGRYLLDDLPVEAAQVSVVPADQAAERAFTMPLVAEAEEGGPRLRREVDTDLDGRFRLPPLVAGTYLLETRLPTGRVHRTEPFDLPAAADLAVETASSEDEVVWQLGELSLTDWLAVEVAVVDQDGEPIAGAEVAARQGRSVSSLVSFRARADGEGEARLSGFDAAQAMSLGCSAPGHLPARLEFELLPVSVRCVLPALARLEGSVFDVSGGVPAGTLVAAVAAVSGGASGDRPGGAVSVSGTVDGEGRFGLEIAPGTLRLSVAAPGHQAVLQNLEVAAGETLDLGVFTLAAGRPLEGRVVEAEQQEGIPLPLGPRKVEQRPVPGAEVRAIEPAGAAWAVADEQGKFSISSIGDAAMTLEVTAEGFAPARLSLEPQAQRRSQPLVVELHPGGWIRAVVGGVGAPCAGCRLRVQPGGLDLLTDAGGEALSPALLPGRYVVERARIGNLGSTLVAVPRAESQRVRVAAGEISTVRFVTDRPVIRVRFEPALDAAWWLIARTPFGEERVDPEADGFFRVPYRPGSTPAIFLTRFDAASGRDLEVRVATLEVRPLTARPDQPRVLALPEGQVIGRVENRDGGLGGVRVRLQQVSDGAHFAEMWSAGDGRFEIPHVPRGVYSLVLGERAFHFVRVEPGYRVDLGDFRLIEDAY